MKKTLASALSLAIALGSLTACGTSGGGTADNAAEPSQSTAETGGAAEGGSGNTYTFSWGEVNGEDYGAGYGALVFAEKIEELSGGNITIDIFFNGTIGDESESMQGLQMGTLDIFRGNASSLPNYGADLIGATGMPFVFEDMHQFQDVAVSALGQELLQSVEDADCGYVAIGWMVEGPRSLFLTESAMSRLGNLDSFSLADMSGLKIRVPETDLMVDTMDALGASATAIAYAELYTSLQSGVVDGAENGVTGYITNSFHEVAPYFVEDAHTFGAGVVLISTSVWNKLNETEQGWMREAAEYARDAVYAYNVEVETGYFEQFDELGVTHLAVSDFDNWQAACQDLYAKYGSDYVDIIDRIQNGNY